MRKKKKKPPFKTGTYKSVKCKKKLNYRSSWEKTVAQYLDIDPLVESYEYESLKIPYVSNINTGRIRSYIPDFLVYYKDGKKLLIEVKPIRKAGQRAVVKKTKAGERWAKENNVKFEVWTDEAIKECEKKLKEQEED